MVMRLGFRTVHDIDLPHLIKVGELNRVTPNGFPCSQHTSTAPWTVGEIEEIKICRRFIGHHTNPLHLNRTWSTASSYNFKHDIETLAGTYICNGSFIVASILEGLELKTKPDHPNCLVRLPKDWKW